MPQPTLNDVHYNRPLTQVGLAYMQNENLFVWNKVSPIVRVNNKSDAYWTFSKGDWFRDEAQKRAPGVESVGSGYSVSNTTYSADVFAIHKDVPDQIANNSDAPMRPYEDAARFVTSRLMLRLEKQWVTDMFTTSVWGTDSTPSNLWSDFASGNPIGDIETAKRTVLLNTGMMVNTGVLGYDVYIQLIQHPDILDRLADSSDRLVTEQKLASIFGVDRIYIARAIENTAVEGETDSFSFVHGKHAWFGYVPSSAAMMQPASSYTFLWTGGSYGSGEDIGVKRFRMEELASDRVEAQIAVDFKTIGSDLGYFFNGAVA